VLIKLSIISQIASDVIKFSPFISRIDYVGRKQHRNRQKNLEARKETLRPEKKNSKPEKKNLETQEYGKEMKPMISIPRNTDLSRYPIFYFFYTYL
jgi:hypothetical protein